MTERQTERRTEQIDQEGAAERSDRERLTTADMAAAATVPAKTSDGSIKQASQEQLSTEKFEPLFGEVEVEDLRSRWSGIQAGFVDHPRESVERADELVAAVMQHLAEVFAAERENLEREWASGDDVSTEDLRLALRRYRSFFDRLLSA